MKRGRSASRQRASPQADRGEQAVSLKDEIRKWFLTGALLTGFITLFFKTGTEDIIKEKLQDWHDRIDVSADYEIGRKLYVVDVGAYIKDEDLLHEVHQSLDSMERFECRPSWSSLGPAFEKTSCASAAAHEVTRLKGRLSGDALKETHLDQLWQAFKDIGGEGHPRLPDKIWVEVKERIRNKGENGGNIELSATLLSNGQKPIDFRALSQAENLSVGGIKSGRTSVETVFKSQLINTSDWLIVEDNLKDAVFISAVDGHPLRIKLDPFPFP